MIEMKYEQRICKFPYSHIATEPHSHRATEWLLTPCTTHPTNCSTKGAAAEGRTPSVEAAGGRLLFCITLWRRGYVVMWLCGFVAMWLCGYSAMGGCKLLYGYSEFYANPLLVGACESPGPQLSAQKYLVCIVMVSGLSWNALNQHNNKNNATHKIKTATSHGKFADRGTSWAT